MSGKRFARAPRRPASATPWQRDAMEKRLVADPRFRQLKGRSRSCLLVAVREFAGPDGRFWPKVATWAERAQVSRATLKRAIADAVDVGLLQREPYLRPDGLQGSTTYLLPLNVVRDVPGDGGASEADREPPCRRGAAPGEPPCRDDEPVSHLVEPDAEAGDKLAQRMSHRQAGSAYEPPLPVNYQDPSGDGVGGPWEVREGTNPGGSPDRVLAALDEVRAERRGSAARAALERARAAAGHAPASGLVPGDDGYRAAVNAAHAAGHLTDGELRDRRRLHCLLVRTGSPPNEPGTLAALAETFPQSARRRAGGAS